VGNVKSALVVWTVVGDAKQITSWYAVRSAFLGVLAVAAVVAVSQEQSEEWPGQSLRFGVRDHSVLVL